MAFYGARKILTLDKSVVAFFDRPLGTSAIKEIGVNTVMFDEGAFLLIGDELVIPVAAVIGFNEGVDLLLAGGDGDSLYSEPVQTLHLDTRAIMKLGLWMEMVGHATG